MTNPVVTKNGSKYWYDELGQRHRADGPAVITDEYESWYFNGELHREDGPAIIWKDGEQHWYINGELHRMGGPAIESPNGRVLWAWQDKGYYTVEKYCEVANIVGKAKTFLLLKYSGVTA